MSEGSINPVYVTGANGFLGAEITKYLATQPQFDVQPVARRSLPPEVAHVPARIQPDVYAADWFDPTHKDAVIVHCIGPSNPRAVHISLAKASGEQVLPHVAMVENLLAKGWNGRLLFLSSGGAIYGDTPTLPISEQNTTNPKSTYGLHKLLIENAFSFLSQTGNFEYASLRVSNPYGSLKVKPGQGVVPIILNALMKQESFEIYGDGSALRDYLHVDDLNSAIDTLATVPFSANPLVLNIGSGLGVALNDVITTLEQLTGRELQCIRRHTQQDVQSNVLDCTLAFNLFGWKAKQPLESGLKNLVEKARAGISED